jgi:hypothetical protein
MASALKNVLLLGVRQYSTPYNFIELISLN